MLFFLSIRRSATHRRKSKNNWRSDRSWYRDVETRKNYVIIWKGWFCFLSRDWRKKVKSEQWWDLRFLVGVWTEGWKTKDSSHRKLILKKFKILKKDDFFSTFEPIFIYQARLLWLCLKSMWKWFTSCTFLYYPKSCYLL